MSYSAVICKLENIRPIEKADRLRLATVCFQQVVVGLESKNGDIGVFFPEDGCLSKEMLHHNNLYSHSELNFNKEAKGYFDDKGRVRCQKFRGERSEGFWTPLKALEWTGVNVNQLEEGFEFTSLAGKEVCRKYIPKRNQPRGNKGNKKSTHRSRSTIFGFRQHFDTKHLRRELKGISDESIIHLTFKAHGTSARTGHLLVEREKEIGRIKRWWYRNFRKNKKLPTEAHWRTVTGTRRVDLNPFDLDKAKTSEEYLTTYGRANRGYRIKASYLLEKAGIPKGYTIYYEIVGYEPEGRAIQRGWSVDKINDKELKKKIRTIYGPTMNFSYGCEPLSPKQQEQWYSSLDWNPADPELFRNLIYRVTYTNPEGLQEDLSWQQVKRFCHERGLETVVEASRPFLWDNYEESGQDLLELVESLHDGPDPLDGRHIREGICIRVESPRGITILKDKTWVFKQLEQGAKDSGAVDTEEQEELLNAEEE